MTTRAELRATLTAFRAMVRERGPRECLEVAAVRWTPQWLADAHPLHSEEYWQAYRDWCFVQKLPRRCALAALRWWRWANRGRRYVLVREVWGKTDEDIWYEDLYF